jgi:hypothetical protein
MMALDAVAKQHIALGDRSYCAVDHVHLDALGAELQQRIGECFHGTVHVALDDEVEFLEVADRETTADLVQRDVLVRADALFALQLLAARGDGDARRVRPRTLGRYRPHWAHRPDQGWIPALKVGLRHLLATFVEHVPHTTAVLACEDHIALTQRSSIHEQGGDVTAALLQGAFDHHTVGAFAGIGLQVEQFGLEQHLLQQLIDAGALLGTDLLGLELAAPFLHQDVHLRELLTDLLRVGTLLVDLVEGEDHGHASGLRVVDGFARLGHHAVIRRDHDDGDVGDLRTTRTHGGEGLVTRCIQEGDALAVVQVTL